MRRTSAAKFLAVAISTFGLTGTATQAQQYNQQYNQGVDPNLVMALEQMISYVYQGCSMGNQQMCMGAQQMQMEAQNLIGAGQYCFQTGDPNACQFYQYGVMQAQTAYAQMMQGGQQMQNPGYNTGNPLGATHEERMANIAGWGAQNTLNWQNNQITNETNHNSFLDNVIRN